MDKDKVCVRFAPSPTGLLHIGGLRTALFNWLFARQNQGKFILRIEDTDRERYQAGATENIIEALKWYGLDFDEGPIFQSARTEIYKKHAQQLIEQGNAYYCFCTPERLAEVRKVQQVNKQATKYDGLCRTLSKDEVAKKLAAGESYVVRLKVPSEGITKVKDLIYGQIAVANVNVDDQVLLKSDGFPTYHLANVVDDYKQGVTHVIRAEEWLPSTPKHIILYQAFDWTPPKFAHLPMVLGSDRTKLSKRHGAKAALAYRDSGYLPEAVLNFIALLGWNPKTEKEFFTIDELVKEFDLTKVNKSSAIFNVEKLNWLSGQHIKKMSKDKLVAKVKPFIKTGINKGALEKIIALAQDRLSKLSELTDIVPFFFTNDLDYESQKLVHKKDNKDEVIKTLTLSLALLDKLDESDFIQAKLKECFEKLIKENKLNNRVVLWPLRVAVTGLEKSPGVFEVMEVLGKEQSVTRVKAALENLQNS